MKNVLNCFLAGIMTIASGGAIMFVTTLPAIAQNQRTVSVAGKVTDNTSEPLIGVTVLVKGTSTGGITDIDGKYSLHDVPIGSTLVFSYVGYNVKEVVVTDSNPIDVVLDENLMVLDEVVVVGYGVQKKKFVTGATVQVKGDDVARMNTTSALSALQSQMPGVNIVANNGQPGQGFKVNIRGLGTIGDAQPLYVIDGVAGGDINTLNPADIESVDVLKDAASAAIYGSRAANGVILVTTKQGVEGKTSVSYDMYAGWQNLYKKPDILNAQQYMKYQDALLFALNAPLTNWEARLGTRVYNMVGEGWEGSDWIGEALNKNALEQNHAINITGGSRTSKYSAGISYTNQDGIIGKPITPNYERYTARFNSNHVLLRNSERDIIKFGENINFFYTTSNKIAETMAEHNDMRNLLIANVLLPVYNQNGGYYSAADKESDGWGLGNDLFNPLLVMENDHGRNLERKYGLNAMAYLEIEPIKNLSYRGSFSYRTNADTYRTSIIPYRASGDKGSNMYQVHQESSIGHKISVENVLCKV